MDKSAIRATAFPHDEHFNYILINALAVFPSSISRHLKARYISDKPLYQYEKNFLILLP